MQDYGTGLYAPIDLVHDKKTGQRAEISNALNASLQRRPTQNDLQNQGVLYHNHSSVVTTITKIYTPHKIAKLFFFL
jgi:hypothetical protein